MKKIELKTKLVALTGAVSLVLGTALPAFAGVSATASNTGNGVGSSNETSIEVGTETTVVQDNTATIHNDIQIGLNTGHNHANYNTGGDVSVQTGGASATIGVSNSANANFAELNPCGGCDSSITVENTQNGAHSDNEAEVEVDHTTGVFQTNNATVNNDVKVGTDTGHNNADYNTNDNGTVGIETGPADTIVSVDNAVNSNHASVGNSETTLSLNAGSGSNEISVHNDGNGAFSKNEAEAKVETETTIVQDNNAKVGNKVAVEADTGHNEAKYNTGGDTGIETGPADLEVDVNNGLNLNAASTGACCDSTLSTENHKNGVKTHNESEVKYDAENGAFQTNDGMAANGVGGSLDTGHNNNSFNTADGNLTGMIDAVVAVDTSANTNILGDAGFDYFDWSDFVLNHDNGTNGGSHGGWLWMWLMH